MRLGTISFERTSLRRSIISSTICAVLLGVLKPGHSLAPSNSPSPTISINATVATPAGNISSIANGSATPSSINVTSSPPNTPSSTNAKISSMINGSAATPSHLSNTPSSTNASLTTENISSDLPTTPSTTNATSYISSIVNGSSDLPTTPSSTTNPSSLTASPTSPTISVTSTSVPTGLCELYRGGATCARFLAGKRVFVDPRPDYTQDNVSDFVDGFVKLLSQHVDASNNTYCNSLRLEFLCRYLFPDCVKENSGGVTFARVCKENCERIFFGSHRCASSFATSQGAALVYSDLIAYNAVQTDASDFACTLLPTIAQSNNTCMKLLPQLETLVTTMSTVLTASNSGIDYDICSGRGDGGCRFPFEYNGYTYYSCTTVLLQYSGFRPWCSTKVGNYYGHFTFRNCYCSEPVRLNTSCQVYQKDFGDFCYPNRGGRQVFIDDGNWNATRAIMVEAERTIEKRSLQNRCRAVDLRQAVCSGIFPHCLHINVPLLNETVYPGLACREACESVVDTCSKDLNFLLDSLKTFAVRNDFHFIQFALDYPICQLLPSKNDTPLCKDFSAETILTEPPYHSPTMDTAEPAAQTVSLLVYILPSVGFVLLLLILIIVLLVCARNRRHKKKVLHVNSVYYNSQSGISLDENTHKLQSTGLSMRNLLEKIQATRRESQMSLSVSGFDENPNFSSSDIPDVPLDAIDYIRPLGEGAFGQVFMGLVSNESGKVPVAVKVLKDGNDEKAKEDFDSELNVMVQLRHEKIVSLLAKSVSEEPYCMVFEFMCYGDLNDFVRKAKIGDETHLTERDSEKHVVTIDDLKSIVRQICLGLKYLEERRFVHRDVATRNCLVGKELTTKISDFGLSRDIYSSDYYRVGGKAFLPIRWMPPESIVYGKFTVKSDIWSFGVLMWEVYTLGKQPYYGQSNEEVIRFVVKGGRLSCPDDFCPSSLHDVMKRCWELEPKSRPFAHELLELLDDSE